MGETAATFQFANPAWLWALALLPPLWLLYAFFYRPRAAADRLAEFADPHLLPHLLAGRPGGKEGKKRLFAPLTVWSLIWALGVAAMAGPRWDYTEVKAYAPSRNLVILLEMAQTMDADDIKPSRMARARQEIEDILRLSQGLNIALIAFDAVPHAITPLTDDRETLARLLPSLNTGLVFAQGADLAAALTDAGAMLEAAAGDEKHVLVLGDGEFSSGDAAILKAEKALAAKGINTHVLALGTTEGAPVPAGKNGLMRENGHIVVSRLDEQRLRRIAADGNGLYRRADYLDSDTNALLSAIGKAETARPGSEKTTRFWRERFYIFLVPLALLLLPWFRRGAAFPVLLLAATFLLHPSPACAADWRDLFMTKDQQGKQALEKGDYGAAQESFSDPYRRGVAQYKAGQYEQAEQSFAASSRPEIGEDAQYNLGNSQLMAGKPAEAIKTYEALLKDHPDNADAQHNLEIAKKLLDQQQQNQDQDPQQNQNGGAQQNQDGNNENPQQDKPGNNDSSGDNNDGKQQQDNNDRDKQDNNRQDQSGQNQQNQDKDSQAGREEDDKRDQQENPPQNGQNPQEQNARQDDERDTPPQPGKQPPQQPPRAEPPQTPQQAEANPQRPQQDIDADQWLNRVRNDPETFLKNKFYIESQQRQGH